MTADWQDIMEYSDGAIGMARDDALDWLIGNRHGYPRSRAQEDANTVRRGYQVYDEEAPPIYGYEQLEREGLVRRLETVTKNGEERVHFELIRTP